MIYYSTYHSPLGPIILGSDGRALTGLWFPGQKYFPRDTMAEDERFVFGAARFWLDCYFAGDRPDPRRLRLAPAGSDFRRTVWRLLLDVPYGGTTTYSALAEKAARALGLGSMSAQAVGGAVGHNPISIIIPCHRVLGADGSLTGYAGGLAKKRWLLAHEGAAFKEKIASL